MFHFPQSEPAFWKMSNVKLSQNSLGIKIDVENMNDSQHFTSHWSPDTDLSKLLHSVLILIGGCWCIAHSKHAFYLQLYKCTWILENNLPLYDDHFVSICCHHRYHIHTDYLIDNVMLPQLLLPSTFCQFSSTVVEAVLGQSPVLSICETLLTICLETMWENSLW